MTEERLEPTQTQNQAVTIVHCLINFKVPEDSSELTKWLENVKELQDLLLKCWEDDRTGSRRVMVECLNVLYDVIAFNQTPVSPAAWSILGLVEEANISEIVEGILNDPNTNEDSKVKNALLAIVKGLCEYGCKAPCLKDWTLALIHGLQMRKNFAILTTVAELTISRLMCCLKMNIFRFYVYPVLRIFLFSVATPKVFYKIIREVPKIIIQLEKESDDRSTRICLNDFVALVYTLLDRFPPIAKLEAEYKAIRIVLMKQPEVPFDAEKLMLWETEDNRDFYAWSLQSVLSDYEVTPRIPYRGLMNQGNTCFMNSVLQILYMTTRFRSEILEKETDPSERAAINLQQLFAFMQESSRNVLVPNGVMDSTLPPTFRRGHQQDSSEYLIYLLDILHENENKIIRRERQSNSALKISGDKTVDGNGDPEATTTLKQSAEERNTIVERLFGGVTMSTTVCSFCKRSFPKSDSFRDLHLSLPDSYELCDLQELINVSLQPEELCSDNMYDCSNCGAKRNATRKQTIIKAPEHLILTLKLFRFDPVRKQRLKLHSRLKNARTIELPVYNSSQIQTKVVNYDVKGVVLHSGASLDGGHYFSSAVDHSGQWYIFNDSVVSIAKYEWNGGSGTPYILVLRQSHIPDPPKGPLPTNLQILVNRDNQKYLAERQRMAEKKKDYDDDYDDSPPNNGSLGGPGPSLVF